MIGDRLLTDVGLARTAGMASGLALTGATTLADAEAIQSLIAQRRQKKIALVLVSVPAIVLDPARPPARDATVTIPARTATPEPTPGPTLTPTPTATPALAPTPTPAPSPSPTSVPPAVGNSPRD